MDAAAKYDVCCNKFAVHSCAPNAGIEECDGEWFVNGCCGGGCYVLSQIKFCPFCGAELSRSSRALVAPAGVKAP